MIQDYIKNNAEVQKQLHNSLSSYPTEFENFRVSNQEYFTHKLDKREEEYYKFTRCRKLIALYNAGLIENPIYIPRKFRHDDYHVMTEEELNIISKLDLKKLQSECEILTLRREEFKSRTETIDKEFEDFINQSIYSQPAKEMAKTRWDERVNEDESKIERNWDKKLESTMLAYEKDKEFLKEHQDSRLNNCNKSQEDSCSKSDHNRTQGNLRSRTDCDISLVDTSSKSDHYNMKHSTDKPTHTSSSTFKPPQSFSSLTE